MQLNRTRRLRSGVARPNPWALARYIPIEVPFPNNHVELVSALADELGVVFFHGDALLRGDSMTAYRECLCYEETSGGPSAGDGSLSYAYVVAMASDFAVSDEREMYHGVVHVLEDDGYDTLRGLSDPLELLNAFRGPFLVPFASSKRRFIDCRRAFYGYDPKRKKDHFGRYAELQRFRETMLDKVVRAFRHGDDLKELFVRSFLSVIDEAVSRCSEVGAYCSAPWRYLSGNEDVLMAVALSEYARRWSLTHPDEGQVPDNLLPGGVVSSAEVQVASRLLRHSFAAGLKGDYMLDAEGGDEGVQEEVLEYFGLKPDRDRDRERGILCLYGLDDFERAAAAQYLNACMNSATYCSPFLMVRDEELYAKVISEGGPWVDNPSVDTRTWIERHYPQLEADVYTEGDPAAAMCAQFSESISAKGQWRRCANPDCGRFFTVKQGATSSSGTKHSDSRYCCEKCALHMRNLVYGRERVAVPRAIAESGSAEEAMAYVEREVGTLLESKGITFAEAGSGGFNDIETCRQRWYKKIGPAFGD